jgi:hypothetical protein
MIATLHALAEGAIAGSIATVPMSGAMAAAGTAGLMGRQPPELIAGAALAAAGAPEPSREAEMAVAAVAHLGFGMAMGALYALLERRLRPRTPPVLNGIGFGLAVWAVSYRGWVPALGIMPPPERDRPGRPASMVAAHVVYGAALGALVGR